MMCFHVELPHSYYNTAFTIWNHVSVVFDFIIIEMSIETKICWYTIGTQRQTK